MSVSESIADKPAPERTFNEKLAVLNGMFLTLCMQAVYSGDVRAQASLGLTAEHTKAFREMQPDELSFIANAPAPLCSVRVTAASLKNSRAAAAAGDQTSLGILIALCPPISLEAMQTAGG